MGITVMSVGIMVNAFVCATVASAAIALSISFARRWQRLTPTLEAYAWFWWFTALVWAVSAGRYVATALGYAGPWIGYADIVVQGSVFFGGPALFAYLAHRVFQSERVATWLSLISFLLGVVAFSLALQPNGVSLQDVTDFSAEARINDTALAIFGLEIVIALVLLFRDLTSKLKTWVREGKHGIPYEALYSVPLIAYILIGTIDESKLITSWPLVIFRLLYVTGFLFVYVIISQEEAQTESYLLSRDGTTTTYGT